MIKKLINTPQTCVDDAVEGALLTDPRLRRIEGLNVLVRSDFAEIKDSQVTIISGGGSGHEPAHAGFIGASMLTAAVLGNVFASPSVSSILAAIRVVAGPKGVLLVVKNYTGDRLNFGMASEMARQEGIKVAMIIVADDCALPLGKGITGGRGLAGTIFVHKVAGACAARGGSLEEVHAAAEAACATTGTLGVALSTCTVPGTPASDRLSQPGLIEVGMGIHGEPGREQVHLPATGAAEFVAEHLVAGILDQPPPTGQETVGTAKRMSYTAGQRVVVLLNNLGGLPVIEMQIVAGGVMRRLQRRGLVPVRAYSGPFMTSLEMCGVSLSLMLIPEGDNALLDALDAKTSAPAWVPSPILTTSATSNPIAYSPSAHSAQPQSGPGGRAGLYADRTVVLAATRLVCEKIATLEPQLTAYDAICGDGDCGMVMKRGAEYVLQHLDAIAAASTRGEGGELSLGTFFNQLGDALSASMGGTSGVLLELCFRSMASTFLAGTDSQASLADWTAALGSGVKAISVCGGASAGMRTMLDAFLPAVAALQAGGDAKSAAAAAMAGMISTAQMASLAGRSNYVAHERMLGTPDPGAFAVAAAFGVLADTSRLC